jgi:hypothetical protein
MRKPGFCLPERRTIEATGVERRVGVEIELSGIALTAIAAAVQKNFGGQMIEHSPFELSIDDTQLGNFGIELDSQVIKWLGRQMHKRDHPLKDLEQRASDAMSMLAMNIVPCELVAPPVDVSALHKLDAVVADLRVAGGKGTRSSPWYAFGVHFNLELPQLDARTIAAYMKAYLCLNDWLVWHEGVDLSRRIPPFINPFPNDYAQLLVDPEYWPSLDTLIDDYLQYNPTRNRILDMLPLFQHLDAERVDTVVDDILVKPRPTLHYRLPNSEIDDADWTLRLPWNDFMQVEALANDTQRLERWCYRYWLYLQQPMKWPFVDAWYRQAQKCLIDLS